MVCAEVTGLLLLDVYAKWAGPCDVMSAVFKQLSHTHADKLHILPAESDNVYALSQFMDKSAPVMMLYRKGIVVSLVRGANAPMLESMVSHEIQNMQKGIEPQPFVDLTSELQDGDQPMLSHERLANSQSAAETPFIVAEGKDLTLALIKPDAVTHSEAILDSISRSGFNIVRDKKFVFSRTQAKTFYRDHTEKPFFRNLINFMTSGVVHALILEKQDAVDSWRHLCGPTSSKRAIEESPESMRAMYGTDGLRNAVHGSDTKDSAHREIEFIFSDNVQSLRVTTPSKDAHEKGLLIIQPELVNDFTLPYVLPAFTNGGESVMNLAVSSEPEQPKRPATADVPTSATAVEFIQYTLLMHGLTIEKMEQFHISRSKARDIFGEQEQHIENITDGSSIILVVSGPFACEKLKELAGPPTISDARELSPTSFRAKYGLDDIRAGVYVSYSSENANREIDALYPYLSHSHNNTNIEDTVAILKPDVSQNVDVVAKISQKIEQEGFEVKQKREVTLSKQQVENMYRDCAQKDFYNDLVSFMTNSPVLALQLCRQNAVAKWREMIGPLDPVHAKVSAPNSIRALFGVDRVRNAVYGSDSVVQAAFDINMVFVEKETVETLVVPATTKKVATKGAVKSAAAPAKVAASGSKTSLTAKSPGSKTSVKPGSATAKVSASKTSLSASKPSLISKTAASKPSVKKS